MTKICTSIEQSKKLVELGIDVNTADMYYQYFKSYSPSNGVTTGHCDIPIIGSWKEHHISIPDPAMYNADIPAWSLSALLKIIPNVKIKSKVQNFDNKNWCISSHDNKDHNHIWAYSDELVDACVELISKLKE